MLFAFELRGRKSEYYKNGWGGWIRTTKWTVNDRLLCLIEPHPNKFICLDIVLLTSQDPSDAGPSPNNSYYNESFDPA